MPTWKNSASLRTKPSLPRLCAKSKRSRRENFSRVSPAKNFAADDRNAAEHVGITGGFGGVAFDFSAGADAVVADAFVAADVF